jgi:YaaC-like Protein
MILYNAARVDEADLSRYAWSGLRRFRNISEVEDRIIRLHDLKARDRPNARKQASQIRYCLIQAQEYYDAAASVTIATKPVLFYYCIMSLALSEVLIKNSGDSSLDRAREQNKHHGLTLRAKRFRNDSSLHESARSLVAAPLIGPNGKRLGTFELWHRSCREMPLAGRMNTRINTRLSPGAGGQVMRFGSIFASSDKCLPDLPQEGLNLLECMRHLPEMMETVQSFGIEPNIIRGHIEVSEWERPIRKEFAFVIHPAPSEPMDTFLSNLLFHAADGLRRLNFQTMPSGGIIKWSDTPDTGDMRLNIPNGTMWTTEEIRFWPSQQPLNEFGFIYVALYIVGNYARYFPDLWMRDVERSAPLALAVEELLAMAATRMPLLTLSELSRTYFVPKL